MASAFLARTSTEISNVPGSRTSWPPLGFGVRSSEVTRFPTTGSESASAALTRNQGMTNLGVPQAKRRLDVPEPPSRLGNVVHARSRLLGRSTRLPQDHVHPGSVVLLRQPTGDQRRELASQRAHHGRALCDKCLLLAFTDGEGRELERQRQHTSSEVVEVSHGSGELAAKGLKQIMSERVRTERGSDTKRTCTRSFSAGCTAFPTACPHRMPSKPPRSLPRAPPSRSNQGCRTFAPRSRRRFCSSSRTGLSSCARRSRAYPDR